MGITLKNTVDQSIKIINDSLANPKGLRDKLIRYKIYLIESAEGRGMVGEKIASAKDIVVGRWVFSTLTKISGRILKLSHDGASSGMNSQIFFGHALNQICMIKITSENPPKWHTLLKMIIA